MLLSLISLGCPKNTVDSEKIINKLSSIGAKFTFEPKDADSVLINTCGFIKSSINETESVIEEMLSIKKLKKKFLIVLFGCAVSRLEKDLKQKYPEIDAFFGLGYEKEILEYLENIFKSKKSKSEQNITLIYSENFKENLFSRKTNVESFDRKISITLPHYAYLKISEGCDRKCAFCTIPFIRGKYVSRKIESIIEEAEFLAERGVKELIIIAQDTTNYGKDLYKKPMLLNLLQKLEKINEIKWIRILYAYPDNIDLPLMDFILQTPKILNYIDLPIQHSHPHILEKMGRKNTFNKYDDIFNYLRANNNDFCLRTTVITGFPGEKNEHFHHLVNYIKEKKFDRLGVFTYQNEKGTKAYHYDSQINNKVKQKRYEELMLLQQSIHFEKNNSLKDKNFDVIVDRQNGKGQYVGRSYRDAPDIDTNIHILATNVLNAGEIVKVKIVSSLNYDLKGKIL